MTIFQCFNFQLTLYQYAINTNYYKTILYSDVIYLWHVGTEIVTASFLVRPLTQRLILGEVLPRRLGKMLRTSN